MSILKIKNAIYSFRDVVDMPGGGQLLYKRRAAAPAKTMAPKEAPLNEAAPV